MTNKTQPLNQTINYNSQNSNRELPTTNYQNFFFFRRREPKVKSVNHPQQFTRKFMKNPQWKAMNNPSQISATHHNPQTQLQPPKNPATHHNQQTSQKTNAAVKKILTWESVDESTTMEVESSRSSGGAGDKSRRRTWEWWVARWLWWFVGRENLRMRGKGAVVLVRVRVRESCAKRSVNFTLYLGCVFFGCKWNWELGGLREVGKNGGLNLSQIIWPITHCIF